MASDEINAAIKVSAHVLVQLGEELVTDAEQAILECVKNAYDADSPGCTVVVRTQAQGRISQVGLSSNLLRFDRPADNVAVSFRDSKGAPIPIGRDGHPTAVAKRELQITRDLDWTGSIVIEDTGDGLSPESLRSSWLVISGSNKRAVQGKKVKTTGRGRIPLGDKGVGRLGSMKLGDILQIESSQSPANPLGSAVFRWADCEAATTVDEIPVHVGENIANTKKFKGTRVSVLGIRDLHHWNSAERALEITKSLARLISPFEAKAAFPVKVDVDGHKSSLVAVTDTLLSRAIAEFKFSWQERHNDSPILFCEARFKEKLFRPLSGSARQMEKVRAVFEEDDGEEFLEWLKTAKPLSRFRVKTKSSKGWLVEIEQSIEWEKMIPTQGRVEDPGSLNAAFYYFHLPDLSADVDDSGESKEGELDNEAAAGIGIDRSMVKEMAGISILRDGFRVRSPGDWLKMAEGMTTGSTYNLRYHNTIGYFALTGEHNFRLVEKSDREGFVDNAAFRGFMAVADQCKVFANEAIETVRRCQDTFAAQRLSKAHPEAPKTPDRSLAVVETAMQFATSTQRDAESVVDGLKEGIALFEASGDSASVKKGAVTTLRSALAAAKTIQKNLESGKHVSAAVRVLRQDMVDSKERMLSLYESAAVGLSARGLAHELRTHIVEIRRRTSALETIAKDGAAQNDILPHLRAIRASCGSIASAAALIDPMLPRTRAVKEAMELSSFVQQYIENRQTSLDAEEISFKVADPSNTVVRMNRGRLLAVLDNLVRNSVYWLKRGKAVMGVERSKQIRIVITPSGFTYADSGPGIDPAYEESLFDIFVTAKPAKERGQGLGLFIVTQLLAADGCDIHLAPERNKDGRRCKFVVDLSSVAEER